MPINAAIKISEEQPFSALEKKLLHIVAKNYPQTQKLEPGDQYNVTHKGKEYLVSVDRPLQLIDPHDLEKNDVRTQNYMKLLDKMTGDISMVNNRAYKVDKGLAQEFVLLRHPVIKSFHNDIKKYSTVDKTVLGRGGNATIRHYIELAKDDKTGDFSFNKNAEAMIVKKLRFKNSATVEERLAWERDDKKQLLAILTQFDAHTPVVLDLCQTYLIFKYFPNQTLGDVDLSQIRKLDETQFLTLCKRMGDALQDQFHSKNVLHNDVHSGNVRINTFGQDFTKCDFNNIAINFIDFDGSKVQANKSHDISGLGMIVGEMLSSAQLSQPIKKLLRAVTNEMENSKVITVDHYISFMNSLIVLTQLNQNTLSKIEIATHANNLLNMSKTFGLSDDEIRDAIPPHALIILASMSKEEKAALKPASTTSSSCEFNPHPTTQTSTSSSSSSMSQHSSQEQPRQASTQWKRIQPTSWMALQAASHSSANDTATNSTNIHATSSTSQTSTSQPTNHTEKQVASNTEVQTPTPTDQDNEKKAESTWKRATPGGR